MAITRRKNDLLQEPWSTSLDHAALTGDATYRLDKVPAGRSVRIDSVKYFNTTGLAEDTTNTFTLVIKNGAASLADLSIQGEADNEVFTANAHGMATGDGPFQLTGTIPTGLSLFTNYWVIKIDANTFYLATSRANALAGTKVSYTTDGTGVTLIRNLITRVFHTDSDLTPDIGASLAADAALEFTSDTDVAHRVVAAGDLITAVFTEGGTATLPAGRLVLSGRLL